MCVPICTFVRFPEMIRLVHIVGTSHVFQRPPPTRREEALQFKGYLGRLCRKHSVAAIGEELSVEDLQGRDLKGSICDDVALELGIEHRYCNPSRATQASLAIPQGREGFAARESYWLGQLIDLGCWPCVFVCGAGHVARFKQVLSANGLVPLVARRDWVPNYALLSEEARIVVRGPN